MLTNFIKTLALGFLLTFLGCRSPDERKHASQSPQVAASSEDDELLGRVPSKFFKPSPRSDGQGYCPTPSPSASSPDASSRLSDAYLNNCSGCHGTTGEGKEGFPSLRSVQSLERFTRIVRKGGSRMPFFDAELISKDDLAHDFELLASKKELISLSTQNVPVQTDIAFDDSFYLKSMKEGLVAWRTPGERGACSSCHGPDGIDLARMKYPNSAILRRALGQSLPADKSIAIVRMIGAQRWRYGIENPCDPTLAPLQPGGRVLEGTSSFDKDSALFRSLQNAKIDLGSTIQSSQDADALIGKIAALDARSIPIAIPLDPWTHDAFHGENHRSTSEWIPEIPMEPKSDADAGDWIDIQNKYLENPNDANLWILLDGVKHLNGARFTSGGVSERIAKEKYKAVLTLQHMMRLDQQVFPDLAKTSDLNRFSIWETAQIANVMARGCAEVGDANDPFPCWKYPQSFYKKMGTDRNRLLNDVLHLNLNWLIAGWVQDPGLQLTEGGDAQIGHLHEASERSLTDGTSTTTFSLLPLHDLYFGVMRLVKSIEAPDVRFPVGPHLDEKAVKSCWNVVGQGLEQWTSGTLPYLRRVLDENRQPAISSDHRVLVMNAVTSIHRVILQKIKDRSASISTECSAIEHSNIERKDVVLAIGKWHSDMKSEDVMVKALVSELSAK